MSYKQLLDKRIQELSEDRNLPDPVTLIAMMIILQRCGVITKQEKQLTKEQERLLKKSDHISAQVLAELSK